MDPLSVFIYTIAVFFVLYLAFFIYVFVSLLTFQRRLNQKLVAFSVLFKEKKDVLLSFYAYLDGRRVEMDSSIKESCAKICWLHIDSLKESEVRPLVSVIGDFQKRLVLLVSQNDSLAQDDDVRRFLGAAMDIDSNYRRILATYNSDIIGYEYWRKMWLYRPLFFLFGFRKRNRIA